MVAPRLSLVSSKVSQTALKQTLRSMVEDRTALDSSLSERTYVEPFLSLSLVLAIYSSSDLELTHTSHVTIGNRPSPL